MSTNSPWDEFERGTPSREPISSPVPADPVAPQARQETSSPWGEETPAEPSFDALIAPTPVSAPPRGAWDEPESIEPVLVDEQRETPAYIPYERPRSDSRVGRMVAIVVAGTIAVAGIAAAVVWGVPAFLSGASEGKAVATEEPTPTQTPKPQPPLSGLRSDPRADLSFGVDLTGWSTSHTYLSNVTDGFSKEGSGWAKADDPSKGYVGYSKDGCTVQWSQKDQTFDPDENDYSASLSVLKTVTGSDSGNVQKYAYWTKDGKDKIVGSSEVVESRVDDGSKSVTIAARAVTEIGQVGLIWSSCTDPSKLDSFVKDIRPKVGFILLDSRS